MCLALDVIVVSVSGGVLVYSGVLLVPSARIRVQDIVVEAVVRDELGDIHSGFPEGPFPETDVCGGIHAMFDSQVGLGLLIAGTLGTAFATIICRVTALCDGATTLPAAMGFAALGFGIAWGVRHLWQLWREARVIWTAFLSWLDRELAPWQSKGWDLSSAFNHTVRRSGFSLLRVFRTQHPGDDTAVLREVLKRARQYHYRWGSAGIQSLAEERSVPKV
jgi:hypothetical protein